MDPALLATALAREPVNDDGRSGAVLERVLLADGSQVVVKRFDPAIDLVMRLTGDDHGREVDLFRQGALDRLPSTVRHPWLGGWYDEAGHGVLVMRDLGDAVLTWRSVVTREQATTMLGAVADLHRAFLGAAPEGLAPLRLVLGTFEPRRIRPYAGEALVDHVLRGWELWPEVASDDAALRLGLLAGLTWLGWNRALDIVEHRDPAVRERERAALSWWLHQATMAFDSGLI